MAALPGARLVPGPPWPPCVEGWTRFVCFSDTHGCHFGIPVEHRPSADVLLHAGDITDTGELEHIQSFAQWLRDYPARHKVVVAGNHDLTLNKTYYNAGAWKRHGHSKPYSCDEVRQTLRSECIYLHNTSACVMGYRIFGSPHHVGFSDWAFGLPSGKPLRKVWSTLPNETDVVITHGPPLGVRDRCTSGKHVGCTDLLEAIHKRPLSVALFGHIHEGYGASTDGVTLFVNASTCTVAKRPTNPPIVFDLPPSAVLRSAMEHRTERGRSEIAPLDLNPCPVCEGSGMLLDDLCPLCEDESIF